MSRADDRYVLNGEEYDQVCASIDAKDAALRVLHERIGELEELLGEAREEAQRLRYGTWCNENTMRSEEEWWPFSWEERDE